MVIGRAGAGIDKIDLAACTANDVAVFNAPDTLTHATASSAFLLILALAKRLPAQRAAGARRPLGPAAADDGRRPARQGAGHRRPRRQRPRARAPDAALGHADHRLLAACRPGRSGRDSACGWFQPATSCSPRPDFVTLHNRLDARTRGMIGAAEIAAHEARRLLRQRRPRRDRARGRAGRRAARRHHRRRRPRRLRASSRSPRPSADRPRQRHPDAALAAVDARRRTAHHGRRSPAACSPPRGARFPTTSSTPRCWSGRASGTSSRASAPTACPDTGYGRSR